MDDLQRGQDFRADELQIEIPEWFDPLTDKVQPSKSGDFLVVKRKAGAAEQTGTPPMILNEDQAVALGIRSARLMNRVAFLEELLKEAKAQCEAALAKVNSWYGPAMLAWAQSVIGSSTPRQYIAPGAKVHLRKQPIRVVLEDLSAFKRWDRQFPEIGLSRRAAGFNGLSQAELDQVIDAVGALPREIQVKFKAGVEIRKSEAKKHFEATGEIPGGCDVIDPGDKVYFDVTSHA